MGQHQEVSGGVASVVSRDASLTETGIEEAARAGSLMKEAGLFQQRVLVVISPFTRTLQTAICVFGTPQWELPTLIEPKAGEIKPIVAIKDSTKRNALKILGVGKALGATQQGDRGSTPKELNIKFPPHMHPQFGGFCAVERYCASHGDIEGKWWHHGHSSGNENNRADALDRCENLRRGIVQAARERGCDTVLLVSHGGFLKMARSIKRRTLKIVSSGCSTWMPKGRYRAFAFARGVMILHLPVVLILGLLPGHLVLGILQARQAELPPCCWSKTKCS